MKNKYIYSMKMDALPTKFTFLLLLLLYISAWLNNAHALSAVQEVETFSSEKGLVDGDGIATNSIKKTGGGKMVLAHDDIKRTDIKGNGARGGTSKTSSANDKVVGKYGYEGDEVMSIGGNKRSKGGFSQGVNESGFVVFNADYHEPRHHPPKNN